MFAQSKKIDPQNTFLQVLRKISLKDVSKVQLTYVMFMMWPGGNFFLLLEVWNLK